MASHVSLCISLCTGQLGPPPQVARLRARPVGIYFSRLWRQGACDRGAGTVRALVRPLLTVSSCGGDGGGSSPGSPGSLPIRTLIPVPRPHPHDLILPEWPPSPNSITVGLQYMDLEGRNSVLAASFPLIRPRLSSRASSYHGSLTGLAKPSRGSVPVLGTTALQTPAAGPRCPARNVVRVAGRRSWQGHGTPLPGQVTETVPSVLSGSTACLVPLAF